jgi:hypothetical protein
MITGHISITLTAVGSGDAADRLRSVGWEETRTLGPDVESSACCGTELVDRTGPTESCP